MHFSFIKALFTKHDVDIQKENGTETVYIKNDQFEDPIVIHYFPDDYYTYHINEVKKSSVFFKHFYANGVWSDELFNIQFSSITSVSLNTRYCINWENYLKTE